MGRECLNILTIFWYLSGFRHRTVSVGLVLWFLIRDRKRLLGKRWTHLFLYLLYCGGRRAGSAVTGTSTSEVKTFWSISAATWLTELPLESSFLEDNFWIKEGISGYIENLLTGNLHVEEFFHRNTNITMLFKTLWVVQRPLEEVFKPYNFSQVTYSGGEKIGAVFFAIDQEWSP